MALREFREDEVDDLVTIFADPAILAWNTGPSTREQVVEWMRHRNDRLSPDHLSWAVEHEGRLAGSVSLFHIDRDQGDAELGYWVAPWARRRGVGTAALAAASAVGFTTLVLRRLFLFHAVENLASCGVASAAGFLVEGTLRESHRYGDGRHHDEHLHGRLATD